MRDRVDEVYECSRTVCDKRYQYIRNYMPHRGRMQHSNFSERTPIRQEIRRLAAEGSGRMVSYDYGLGAKCPLPPAVRSAVLALEEAARRSSRNEPMIG